MEESTLSKPLELTYEEYQKRRENLVGLTIDQFKVTKELGRGQFGTVYQCLNKKNQKFALKLLDLRKISLEPNQRIRLIKERLVESEPIRMMQCESPNLLKCFHIFRNKDLKVLVMEYCSGKTLDEHLRKKKKLDEEQAVQILRQIITGIAELHQHKIVHRDLKTQNIMEHEGQYKIIDFGFSKKLDIEHESEQIKNTLLGTPTTMAPQVFLRKNYGLKADIWSIGIIFFSLVFGLQPYDSSNAKKFYNEIEEQFKKKKFEFNRVILSDNAHNFLSRALRVDTDERMSWKQMLEHPLIKNKEDELIPQRFLQRASLILQPVDSILEEDNLRPSEFCIVSETQTIVEVQRKEEEKEKEIKEKPVKVQKYDLQANMAKEKEKARKLAEEIKEKQQKRRSEKMKQEVLENVEQKEELSFQKCKLIHFDILKTQLAYRQIFLPIQRHNMLNIKQRQSLEFMHLLLSRCFKYMSPLKEIIRINKDKLPRAYLSLDAQVSSLYEKVKHSFDEYDEKLREKENKMVEMGKDFFSKIIYKEHNENKNKFIGGIQRRPSSEFGDYTIRQQIDYTCQYIEKILPKIVHMGDASKKVKKYLTHYNEIMSVQKSDIPNESLNDYVRRITL